MKKTLWVIFTAVFLFAMLSVPKSVAYAEKKSEASLQSELEKQIDKYVEQMDLGEFEEFVRSIDDDRAKELSIRSLVKKLTKGEISFEPSELFNYLAEGLSSSLSGTLASLLTVVVLAVLGSVLSGLTSGFLKKQTVEIVHYVIYILVVTIITVKIAVIVKESSELIQKLTGFTERIFPPLVTLMSALGGSVSSSLYKPQLALFCAVISKLIGTVIFPLFTASIAFCLIGNLSSAVKMDKIRSAIRYGASFVLSAVFGIFITYLTVAGITGGMVDGVSVKAAKFVVSSYVPILGGYLSQGFDLISAGCMLIKNAIGVIGIFCVITMIIKPIIDICVFTFALKIVASVIQPIGDKRISDLLYSVSNSTKIIITAIVGTGFVFIITFLLICVTGNAGVL